MAGDIKVARRENGVRSVVLAVLITVTPFFVSGAPVVVESRDSQSVASDTVTYQPPIIEDDDNSAMEDQYQLQLLQQEVMTLRGLVEELRYELDRTKRTQDDRYLELDARMQQVLKASVTP